LCFVTTLILLINKHIYVGLGNITGKRI